MELFEKAHVIKHKVSGNTQSKFDTTKKQFKQMLIGYKTNDNDLIKSSAELNKDYEDSTSVSGFSDLNLTASSFEADLSRNTLDSDSDNVSITDVNDINSSEIVPAEIEKNRSNNDPSISDYIEEIQSLSLSLQSSSNEDSSDLVSLSHENTTAESSNSENYESFDADKRLAAKILVNLDKSINKNNKKILRKRKQSCVLQNNLDSDKDDLTGSLKNSISDDSGSSKEINYQSNDFTEGEDLSSPFVSVTATDMIDQSLSDILGEYKHPTVKNLPSHNVYDYSIEYSKEECVTTIGNNNTSIPAMDIDIDCSEVNSSQGTDSPNDNSGVFDNTVQSVESIEQEFFAEPMASPQFINPIKVYNKKNLSILVMKHPSELFIHGKVRMKVLCGTIDVFGYSPKTDICDIYAPNYNYAQCVKTVATNNTIYGLFGKLTSTGLLVSEAEEIVTTINQCDVVISFHPLRNRTIEFLENNFTITDLFTKPSKYVDSCFKNTSDIIKCSLYLSKPWKCFEENASWKQVIQCGLNDRRSRCIVCGGKGTGKSTFLRYYVNKMLSLGPILVVDLDPGQSEFTVAGNISATIVYDSLLGPSFTHLKIPEIMFNLGMINTMDNPGRYASAIHKLITHCGNDERLQHLPWIVNTMGMCNSLGLKFITRIILLTKPTSVLQIDSKNLKKCFGSYLHPAAVKNIYDKNQNNSFFRDLPILDQLDYSFFISNHEENSTKSNFSLAPRDERYLNFVAYFGELMNEHRVTGLLEVTPYVISLCDINIVVNVKINEHDIAKVINGKVIALCQQQCHKTGDVFTLQDKPLFCHGHGLIRCIDYNENKLYIITPVRASTLMLVNTLLYADWVPELRGPEKQLPVGVPIPYRTAAAYHQRQFMFAPKRRFNPLQLLKLSRNPN